MDNTKNQNGLPPGWALALLGDLLELNYGKGLTKESRDEKGFPVYGSNGIVGMHSIPLVKSACLIVGRKGSIGAVHLSETPCTPIDTTYFIDKFNGQPIKFWYYFLKNLHLDELNRASAIPGLNRDDAYSKEVFLPPLNEQIRIVSKLEELFARTHAVRESLKEIPTLIEQFRQSVLAAAFRGDLTREWREANPDVEPASVLLERIRAERRRRWEEAELAKLRAKGKEPLTDHWKEKYQEPEPVDTTDLPELPEGWEWVTIGEVFRVVIGSTPSRKEPAYWGDEIPWVSSGEVAFCTITETRESITNEGFQNASLEILPTGTILLGMIGEGKTRGQAAILGIKACNNQNSAAIVVPETILPSEFVYFFLENSYQKTRTEGAGNNQPALNKQRVQQLCLPISPIEEQFQIVNKVTSLFSIIDSIEEVLELTTAELTQLEQSVLSKAFRGELVPQNPNDEPAEVLLERIKQAREETKPKSKTAIPKKQKKQKPPKADEKLEQASLF